MCGVDVWGLFTPTVLYLWTEATGWKYLVKHLAHVNKPLQSIITLIWLAFTKLLTMSMINKCNLLNQISGVQY